MKNQEQNFFSDERVGIRDKIFRNSGNPEKALYKFSSIPGSKSQRMTQNNLSKK
ncbi:hypothetical protein [Salinimicrobium marinum]|uniref:hypothetical protein n=1 Tax=Salinimicrobium marinum TaxID=680283 RepID=UPI001674F51B|nr:hypothetical protein [Salinimicrobium marinum]